MSEENIIIEILERTEHVDKIASILVNKINEFNLLNHYLYKNILKIAEQILNVSGLDINQKFSGVEYSPLHLSIQENGEKAFDKILNYPNLNINSVTISNQTALFRALDYYERNKRNKHFFDSLINKIDVNIINLQNETILHRLAKYNDFNLIKRVLETTDINVYIKNNNNLTALELAYDLKVCYPNRSFNKTIEYLEDYNNKKR